MSPNMNEATHFNVAPKASIGFLIYVVAVYWRTVTIRRMSGFYIVADDVSVNSFVRPMLNGFYNSA